MESNGGLVQLLILVSFCARKMSHAPYTIAIRVVKITFVGFVNLC